MKKESVNREIDRLELEFYHFFQEIYSFSNDT